jgi:hypothetical protein
MLEIKGAFDSLSVGDRDHPAIRERVGALGGYLEMAQNSIRIALPIAPAASRAR